MHARWCIQPRGAFVNTSNTLTGSLAAHAKSAAEGVGNLAIFKATGIPQTVSFLRKQVGKYQEGKRVDESLQTGAGIYLKDVK